MVRKNKTLLVKSERNKKIKILTHKVSPWLSTSHGLTNLRELPHMLSVSLKSLKCFG